MNVFKKKSLHALALAVLAAIGFVGVVNAATPGDTQAIQKAQMTAVQPTVSDATTTIGAGNELKSGSNNTAANQASLVGGVSVADQSGVVAAPLDNFGAQFQLTASASDTGQLVRYATGAATQSATANDTSQQSTNGDAAAMTGAWQTANMAVDNG